MRIDTDLRDIDRDAVKAYADANNYTMRGAYTRLIRNALWGRTSLAVYPEKGNLGIKWSGHDASVRTNVDLDSTIEALADADGEFRSLFMPHSFALDEAGFDLDIEPSIFDMEYDDTQPTVAPLDTRDTDGG